MFNIIDTFFLYINIYHDSRGNFYLPILGHIIMSNDKLKIQVTELEKDLKEREEDSEQKSLSCKGRSVGLK